jgi:hypothetical protein
VREVIEQAVFETPEVVVAAFKRTEVGQIAQVPLAHQRRAVAGLAQNRGQGGVFGRQSQIPLTKAMKYTRFWLKKHDLIADGFFPEMYYQRTSDIVYVELWIPFKNREKNN